MYENHGEVSLGINFDFIGNVITRQAIKDEDIPVYQYLKVRDIEVDTKEKMLILKCDLLSNLIN